MSLLHHFLLMSEAGFVLAAVMQTAVVSAVGFVAVKAVSRQAAPLRSLVALAALTALALTLTVSAVFHVSHISWYKTAPVRSAAAPAVAMARPELAAAWPGFTSEGVTSERKRPAADAIPPARPAPAGPASAFSLDYGQLALAAGVIWLAGAIIMLLRLAYGLIFLRGFKYGLKPVQDAQFDALLRTVGRIFGREKPPLLYTSSGVVSPITIGMSRPVVIIPEKLLGKLNVTEMKSILLHELAHIYSGDHLAGVFKRAVLAAQWWNPLAYLVSAEHSVAREEVADNYVLLELQPKAYSECLAGLAEKSCLINSLPAAAGMAGKYSSLEQRVRKILSKNRSLTMKAGKSIQLVAAMGCGLLAISVAGMQSVSAESAPGSATTVTAESVSAESAPGAATTVTTESLSAKSAPGSAMTFTAESVSAKTAASASAGQGEAVKKARAYLDDFKQSGLKRMRLPSNAQMAGTLYVRDYSSRDRRGGPNGTHAELTDAVLFSGETALVMTGKSSLTVAPDGPCNLTSTTMSSIDAKDLVAVLSLHKKLKDIVIGHQEFKDTDLPTVVKVLVLHAKLFDPQDQGVRIDIKLNKEAQTRRLPKYTLSLDGISLSDALAAICRSANLSWYVEADRVVIGSPTSRSISHVQGDAISVEIGGKQTLEEQDKKTSSIECRSHLKQIALAIFQYGHDHDGCFPPAGVKGLDLLRSKGYLGDPKNYVCPSHEHSAKNGEALTAATCDYIYCPPVKKFAEAKALPSTTPMAWHIHSRDAVGTPDCIIVLFIDGHVEALESPAAAKRFGLTLNEIPAGQVPSPAPVALPASPAMTEAIKQALTLRFVRENNTLLLLSGIEKAPVNVAFTVYGKRERGSGDQWEAFSCFSRNAGATTRHTSVSYQFFNGLEGDGAYRFKFKFVPDPNVARNGECNQDTYYGGTVETDWMSMNVPPRDKNPAALADATNFVPWDSARNDELFAKEWPAFNIRTAFGGTEYWIGAGGFSDNFVQTSPFNYDPQKPYASAVRIVELRSFDAHGKFRMVYNLSPYKLFHNTSFPLYGGDRLFPEPGVYQWQGKAWFFSMSGADMVREKLAVEDGRAVLAAAGVYAPEKAPALLETLRKKYPFQTLDLPTAQKKYPFQTLGLPTAQITAIRK